MDKKSKEMLDFLNKNIFSIINKSNVDKEIKSVSAYTFNCMKKKSITPQEITNRFYSAMLKINGRKFYHKLDNLNLPSFEKIEKEFRKKFLCIKMEF